MRCYIVAFLSYRYISEMGRAVCTPGKEELKGGRSIGATIDRFLHPILLLYGDEVLHCYLLVLLFCIWLGEVFSPVPTYNAFEALYSHRLLTKTPHWFPSS